MTTKIKSSSIHIITPPKTPDYEAHQSKYEQVPKLPIRALLLGASGSGKGVLLSNLIMDVYDKVFSKVYIWSPTIHIDPNWIEVKKHLEDKLKMSNSDELPLYYDSYNPEELEKVIDTQSKVVDYQKKNKQNKIFQILIIVDDFADAPEFGRSSKLLHGLFTRGRHNQISTIISSQKLTAQSPIIRSNVTDMFVFRLRNYSCLQILLDELSALIDKQTMLYIYIYKEAIKEPWAFLLIKLREKDLNNMFMIGFSKTISITDS